MKTNWDYTDLADAYLKRPDYSSAAVEAMLSIASIKNSDCVCDVGAGVAHLTLMLAQRGLNVTAIEPNNAMRLNGIKRTRNHENVSWYEATGESTHQNSQTFELVTFGSSFNVCDRPAALQETARILKPSGWFACLWNHRQLNDPIQSDIESIIKRIVPSYSYGTRREDQTSVIDSSALYGPVVHLKSCIMHEQTIDECVEAWQSHATLARQSGDLFDEVINDINAYLQGLNRNTIYIPYFTNIWMARLR